MKRHHPTDPHFLQDLPPEVKAEMTIHEEPFPKKLGRKAHKPTKRVATVSESLSTLFPGGDKIKEEPQEAASATPAVLPRKRVKKHHREKAGADDSSADTGGPEEGIFEEPQEAASATTAVLPRKRVQKHHREKAGADDSPDDGDGPEEGIFETLSPEEQAANPPASVQVAPTEVSETPIPAAGPVPALNREDPTYQEVALDQESNAQQS